MLTWAQRTGRIKTMPWTTPDRGRGFIPPNIRVHALPIYERPKYGGWTRPYIVRGQLYGFGDDITEAKKQADIAKWKEEAISKTAQQKTERYKKAWWKPEGQMLKQEAEESVLRASGAAIESQQAKQSYIATKSIGEVNKAIDAADKAQTISAYQKALSIATIALNEVIKTGDTESVKQLSSQMDEIRKAIASLIEYEKEKAAYESEMKSMGGLGKSFFKKIFSKPSELKKHLKSSAPTPKKVKARMKIGLKLMKVALKPSGAKLLAKKGGMKAAMTNPDQFFAAYQAKKAAKQQAQQEAEQPSVQPAETYEVEGKVYTREEFIAAFGMTPEQYQAGEPPSTPPVEEQPAPIYVDDPNMPQLPDAPIPTPTEPAPSYDYPAEEYYPDEAAAIDYTMYPEDYIPTEEPYYEGYNVSQKQEVIKGTEWYYQQPFESKRLEEDIPVEYEEFQSEAINPNADWYRNVKEYPHTEEETGYIPPDRGIKKIPLTIPYSERGFIPPDRGRGKVSFKEYETALSGYDIYKPRGSRQRYFPEGYRPIMPRPVTPAFTRNTKTYKYEPEEITNIPVPVSRVVRLVYPNQPEISPYIWSGYGKTKTNF